MDARFLALPLRDRKSVFRHLQPTSLVVTVVKQGLLRSIVVLSDKREPPRIPFHDPAAAAAMVVDQLWLPVVKDLALTQTERALEAGVMAYFPRDTVRQGRFVRGV